MIKLLNGTVKNVEIDTAEEAVTRGGHVESVEVVVVVPAGSVH